MFYIDSHNSVSKDDMNNLVERLEEIKQLARDGLKKRYRELRRSGKDKHGKGAGIGFYEIAKRCTEFNYQLVPQDNDLFHFYFEATIHSTSQKH